jgi:adenylate cyclase
LPNHAELAVQCAIAMQEELVEANNAWAKVETKIWHGQGTTPLLMRIGIHTGAVIAGNIGARSRAKYAVIGDSVNVAARVEQLNKELETETLLTQETLIRIPNLLRLRTVPRGEHKIRGRSQTVTVHSI